MIPKESIAGRNVKKFYLLPIFYTTIIFISIFLNYLPQYGQYLTGRLRLNTLFDEVKRTLPC